MRSSVLGALHVGGLVAHSFQLFLYRKTPLLYLHHTPILYSCGLVDRIYCFGQVLLGSGLPI